MQAKLEGVLGNTNCTGCSLNTRAFKSGHQVFEALAFDLTEQVFAINGKAIKGDFIFFHTAIAEYFNLAATHAFGREGGGVIAARLGGQKHGEAGKIACAGISTCQQCHHVCAHRMGDPCLVARDRVACSVF